MISVIGGANVDRKFYLDQPLLERSSNPGKLVESYGGVGRNIAENLARLGNNVIFFSAVGGDSLGKELLNNLAGVGVDVSSTKISDKNPTGSYTAILEPCGEMAMAFSSMDICQEINIEYLSHALPRLQSSSFFIADMNLPKFTLAWLLDFSKRQGKPLCISGVSPRKLINLPDNISGLDLLYLNQREAQNLVDNNSPLDFMTLASRICQDYEIKKVVVTTGESGLVFATDDGNMQGKIPSMVNEILDSTGAGDAGFAGICHSLLLNLPFEQTCKNGMLLSSLTMSSVRSVSEEISPNTLS